MDGGGRPAEPLGTADPVPAATVRELGASGLDGATVLELARRPVGAEAARPLTTSDGAAPPDAPAGGAGGAGGAAGGPGGSGGSGGTGAAPGTGPVPAGPAAAQATTSGVGLLVALALLTLALGLAALRRRP